MKENRVIFRRTLGFTFFILITMLFLASIVAINSALAETKIPPPVYGIKILEYDDSLVQEAGTTETYKVKIKNTGVLSLYDVKLESKKIPATWFASDSIIDLKFEEVGILEYKLKVPKDASGLYVFSLIARGSYGVSTVSDIEPVVLNVVSPRSNITTAITTTTTITTTTEAIETTTTTGIKMPSPIKIVPTTTPTSETQKLVNELKVVLKAGEAGSEIVFSKFRATVTYVRTTARAILTDKTLMYGTAAALFVVMIILAGIRKVMIS